MLEALWHLARDGCVWRRLPVGPALPPHQSVWSRFLRWRLRAVLDRALAVLVACRRLAAAGALAHGRVDLGRFEALRDHAAREVGELFRAGRVVTLVRDRGDAVAVFGASSPQSRSARRSVGTTLPAWSRRMTRSPRCRGPPSAIGPVSSETSSGPSIRKSSVTPDLRTPGWPVSSTWLQITRTGSKPAQGPVSTALDRRCRPVGGPSDRAGHDSLALHLGRGGTHRSRARLVERPVRRRNRAHRLACSRRAA
jgi:transposase